MSEALVRQPGFQSSHRHHSPLRYPGGKGKLARFIQRLFKANALSDGHYAEPYAGGASVALSLLFGEYASHVHINDLDRSLYAFWHSVLYNTEGLCRLIRDTPLTIAEWRDQRAVQRSKATRELLSLGFSTFYLNRTNRSGIIAGAGVIGGYSQQGQWGMGARYNSADLVRRIEKIANYRDRISLSNLDAEEFLAVAAGTLPARSLVYLDPPYFVKGQQRLYASYYRESDHARIAELLEACPWPWVVSYDSAPEILKLYRSYARLQYSLRYTAAGSYCGREAMFFSPGLVVPPGEPLG